MTLRGVVQQFDFPRLQLPAGAKKVLLHSCCAPCAVELMAAMQFSDIEFSIFFYNPNIHPHREYTLRKDENKRFADKYNIPFIDADADRQLWFKLTSGLENEPERGLRCTVCFDMRLECTAAYAYNNDFDLITTSLGISRWKDFAQITTCGIKAASRFNTLGYWTYNWRKKGGSARMIEMSKLENFYQQEYCGCIYSLRDTNKFRKSQNRPKIRLGQNYYGQPKSDSK